MDERMDGCLSDNQSDEKADLCTLITQLKRL